MEDLVVNLHALLLRFMERGLFLLAQKLIVFAREVKGCCKRYSRVYTRHDPERALKLVEMRRPETVNDLM